MKDRFNTVISVIVTIIVLFGLFAGIRYIAGEVFSSNSEPSMTTAEYKRIGVKACIKEATYGNAITEQDANTYCQCAMDRVYGNKSLEEMRAIDADFIKNGFDEKYDQIVLDCVELIQDNYL